MWKQSLGKETVDFMASQVEMYAKKKNGTKQVHRVVFIGF